LAADRLHIFGIRHHGPGSAASLVAALDALAPERVLIEGPPEADSLIRFAASPEMVPPIALLIHGADDPSLASFYPFADYSPEWQAMLWAARHGRPAAFIDLPAAHKLAAVEAMRAPPIPDDIAGEDATDAPAEAEPSAETGAPGDDENQQAATRIRRDPLGALAAIAGYDDGEAWWNAFIEHSAPGPQIFAAISDAMGELRAHAPDDAAASPPGELEEQREAHMRLAIADCLKETDGEIAVICGAWHVPALRRKVARTDDKAALRNLPKVKVTATWVPWTDTRLATSSGYGAGVISPGWYRHLWQSWHAHPAGEERSARHLAANWLARIAGLLREAGRPISTASVIEAARLAEALAALRGLSLPGLSEMREACLATICQGETVPLKLIEERLVIGTDVGSIDEAVPQMPLAADLARQQKRLKLKPEGLDREAALDLRSDAGLAKSLLLHRLALLNVPWGRIVELNRSRGTFRERWMLRWDPEFSVRLAEALVYGTTIEQAASNAAFAKARTADGLQSLAKMVEACLLAGLDSAARASISLLQARATQSSDIAGLIAAMPPLAGILRYGTARDIPAAELHLLVTSMVEAVCAGLVHACRRLDASSAEAMRAGLTEFNRAASMLDDERLAADWRAALARLTRDGDVAALLRGFATRTLHDQNALDAGETAGRFSRALSPAMPLNEAGQWLDGFLSGGANILLHDGQLLAIIDGWMAQLSDGAFMGILPMLRRVFSGIDRAERRHLLDRLKRPLSAEMARADAAADNNTPPGFAAALPMLLTILGLDKERAA
jgi:hypothetical protein